MGTKQANKRLTLRITESLRVIYGRLASPVIAFRNVNVIGKEDNMNDLMRKLLVKPISNLVFCCGFHPLKYLFEINYFYNNYQKGKSK